VANDIPLGCSLLLPVGTVHSVQTLKAPATTVGHGGRDSGRPCDRFSRPALRYSAGSAPWILFPSLNLGIVSRGRRLDIVLAVTMISGRTGVDIGR